MPFFKRFLPACCLLTLLSLGAYFLYSASQRAVSPATARLIASARADENAGRFPDAFALLQAPRPSASAGDRRALQIALADLQFALAESLLPGSPAAALPHFQAALATDQALRPGAVGGDFNEMGIAYDEMGQPGKAVGFLQQALALHTQAGDKGAEGATLLNLGAASESLHRYDAALGFLQRSAALDQQAGDADGQAKALQNIGIVYDDLHRYDKALGFYQQALPLYRQVGDRRGEVKALANIGLARRDLASRRH